MANINHSVLSDPYLHEPKGTSTALAGQVYIANGSGSGVWKEASRTFGGYLTFSTSSPYSHSATTSDTVLNPTFNEASNNGFTGLSSPNARVRYDGTESIYASLDGFFSMKQASGSSKDVEIVFYKNGTELAGSRMITTATSGEWNVIGVQFDSTLATNDYIEVKVKASATTTVLFASGYLRITGAPV